ncbi:MAG: L,D-transpeptidase family protein [Pseudomonadota bacterium]
MSPWDMVVTKRGLRFLGRTFPCRIGASGTTRAKREGDGATPLGTHGLVGCLYRPDRFAKPVDWAVPIRPRDAWSDDTKHEDYNLMVRLPYGWSHERLARPDPLYDLVLITDWNWPRARRGHGSAIFVHSWRGAGHPTAGCVALRRDHLMWITRRIRHRTKLIVAYE